MTDVDRKTDLTDDELRLRAELARTLVPPPTPASLRLAVDAMAEEHLAAPHGVRRSWREAVGMGARGLRLGAGAVALVVVLAVVGLVLVPARGEEGRVAATPFPTLPAVTQPVLPDPTGAPTIADSGAWIDADTAWAMAFGGQLWMTTDGGQGWDRVGTVPEDGEPAFVDPAHGYAATGRTDADGRHAFGIVWTADGGRTWVAREAGTVPAAEGSTPLVYAHFTDASHGILLGTSVLDSGLGASLGQAVACAGWTTEDGGETWDALASAPCLPLQPWWASPRDGLLTDSTSTTHLTTDGGTTWRTMTVPGLQAHEALYARGFVRAADGSPRLIAWILDRQPLVVTVYEPNDDGTEWRLASTLDGEPGPDARAFADLGGGHWLATGDGNAIPGNLAIWDSYDEGRTWVRAADTLVVADDRITWADRLHGTIHGGWMDCRDRTQDCAMSTPNLWLTNDGGLTWHEVPF